jgi:hypothetical protein
MKKIYILLTAIVSFFLLSLNAYAAEITSIKVEVSLRRDGSASISETWATSNVFEGTQLSKPIDLPDFMTVHTLEVSDIHGNLFTITDDWSEKTDFDSRANHASIVETQNGVELFWGLTDYGDNRYTMTYVIENLVRGYLDGSGLRHWFINHSMNPTPQHFSLMITGYDFEIEWNAVEIETINRQSKVEIDSTGNLLISGNAESGVEFMALFPEGIFEPTVNHDATFVMEAFIPDETPILWMVVTIWIVGVFAFFMVIGLVLNHFYKKTKLSDGQVKKWPDVKKIEKEYGVSSDFSLAAIYYLIKTKNPFATHVTASAFSAILLKWNHEGVIEMGKVNSTQVLHLLDDVNLSNIEKRLYHLLQSASNSNGKISSDDTHLWEDVMPQIEKWEKHFEAIGKNELQELSMISCDGKFTTKGFERLVGFWGFLRYLSEAHKSDELEHGFDFDHLVVATMAGMSRQLKKYHDKFSCDDSDMMNIWMFLWLTHSFSTSAQASYQSSHTYSGGNFGGGAISSGGGGGGIS